MKKLFVIAVMMMVVQFACGAPAARPASVPPTTVPNALAATVQAQNQMGTFVAQTVEAQQPTPNQPTATQPARPNHLLRQLFRQPLNHPPLQSLLLRTGMEQLIAGIHISCCPCYCKSKGFII